MRSALIASCIIGVFFHANIVRASPNCDTLTSCETCAAASSWTGSHCRWCPKDGGCHAEGSPYNTCSAAQQITDPLRCAASESQQPTQIHLALAGVNGMTVSWATINTTATSTVRFGPAPSTLKYTATAANVPINYLEETAVFHHHVTLPDEHLSPGMTVYYQCGDNVGGWSDILSFRTAASPSNEPFSVAVFGDFGYGSNGNAVATRASLEERRSTFDFVWHVGDIAYADDAFLHDITGFEYENIYDAWMNWMQNITSSMPYMVSPGNHESECHSPACLASSTYRNALKNFTAFNARWKMPYASSGSRSNMWYSFDYGSAHFISLDTETDFSGAPEEHHGDSGLLPAGGFGVGNEYLEWLEKDLAKANASRHVRPWVFAGGHRPLYDATSREDTLANAVEELFNKYQVDLFFSGHEHSYARTTPVYQSKPETGYVNPSSTAYIVAGGAGCDEMKQQDISSQTLAPWGAYADQYWGTGVLTVLNDTVVRWQYLHSADNSVADEFFLVKDRR